LISLIISSIISIFLFREFFAVFVLGFILSNYLKFDFLRAILSIMIFTIAFESIAYEFKVFDTKLFYFNFLISTLIGILSYFIKDKRIISTFFYLSYLTKIWKFVLIIIILFMLFHLNFNTSQKLLLFLTFLFFSLPFIPSQIDKFEALTFINGILIGYVFLKDKLDFLIFGGLYIIFSLLPHQKLFKIFPMYLSNLVFYLFNGALIGMAIYFYYNPQNLILLKYPLIAIGIVLLHIAQIVIAFIPGHFVPFMAGYIFGLWGILIDGIGMLFGSFSAYYIAKIYGERIVLKFIKKEDLEKVSKFVNEKGIIGFYILYLIPFTPKDALCFVAGLLKIKEIYFLMLILFIRIPADAIIVLIGAGFKNLDPKIAFYISAIGIFVLIIYFIFSKLFKKN
jgi:uncharacterized membrane protein YdjX (TVP38/TMEM64 family)